MAGLSIKSFNLTLLPLACTNFSSAKCLSSSLASALLWVRLSCCRIRFSASLISLFTCDRFAWNADFTVISFINSERSFWREGISRCRSETAFWFWKWKFTRRNEIYRSLVREHDFIIRMWNGMNCCGWLGNFIGAMRVWALKSKNIFSGLAFCRSD